MRSSSTFAATIALLSAGVDANAADLSAALECRSRPFLSSHPSSLAEQGRAAGFDCRLHERQRQTTVYCTGGGKASAFGVPVKEFNLAQDADGGAILSVAFHEPPSRLQPQLDRARSGLEATAPLASAMIEEREDGVAELRCAISGHGNGVGAIAGRLDFRGVRPLPAMRVCAAPVRKPESPHCVQTASGQADYLIEQLPKGDYYVTAFALEGNPNRLFGVYTSSLSGCTAGATNCPGQRLQRVTVFAGDVRSGIDPDNLMSELPSPLRSTATARQD